MKNCNDAKVILAQCSRSKSYFGIRAEKFERVWTFTWAFPITQSVAKKENFGAGDVSGEINFAHEYPGCPHCGNQGFVRCGACGRLSCMGDGASSFSCPWCGNSGEVEYTSEFNSIKGGDY